MRTLTWESIDFGNFILIASIHLWNQSIENFMSSSPWGCDFVISPMARLRDHTLKATVTSNFNELISIMNSSNWNEITEFSAFPNQRSHLWNWIDFTTWNDMFSGSQMDERTTLTTKTFLMLSLPGLQRGVNWRIPIQSHHLIAFELVNPLLYIYLPSFECRIFWKDVRSTLLSSVLLWFRNLANKRSNSRTMNFYSAAYLV